MLYGLAIIVGVLLVTLLAIQIYRIVVAYKKSTGTVWQRFIAAFSYSHTILLARVAAFMSGFSVFAVNFLPALDPTTTLGAAITGILDPKYATFYALGFALLVEIVRRAPSVTSPILPPPQSVDVPPPPPVPVSK